MWMTKKCKCITNKEHDTTRREKKGVQHNMVRKKEKKKDRPKLPTTELKRPYYSRT